MNVDCPHWSRERDRGQAVCGLGRHGGRPWVGNCQACLAAGENTAATLPTPPPWPLLLRPIRALAQPGDRGLGDIVAREIGPLGGDAYKAWHLRVLKRVCGCEARQDWLNALYPLPPSTTDRAD